jgi:pyridoxal phosphate enzyme (YggS family)
MPADLIDNGVMQDSSARRAEIADGLAAVRDRIRRACADAERLDSVALVVVTKTFPASDVSLLAALGVQDVAENRDQDARTKRREVSGADVPGADVPDAGGGGLRWHMIGQLQRNKAASVARWADVVESVDRAEVALALGRGAEAAGRTLEVLVQVALDPIPEPRRGGVDPAHAVDLAAVVDREPGLLLRGVMGVAPLDGDPDDAFSRLERVASQVRGRWPSADRISAGMSADLEHAVAYGATQVRVGGAILGHRAPVQ